MKIILVLSVVVSLMSFKMHDYFFAFAEMQYSKTEKAYQVSMSTTAHDFEHHMKLKGVDLGHIENVKIGSELFKKIEKELEEGFNVYPKEGKKLNFTLIGLEVDLTDKLVFYLKSQKCEKATSFEITFNLMMETFEKQQNKMNILNEGNKESLTFVNTNRTRTIELK